MSTMVGGRLVIDELVSDLLEGGPVTLEAAFQRLVGVAPDLAARGQPWLARMLRRHPAVRLLPGATFELRSEGEFVLEVEEPRPIRQPDRRLASQREETSTDLETGRERAAFVVIDLETNPDRAEVTEHEIIEIGACLVEDDVVTARFESLVRPTRPLLGEISELIGLEAGQLSDAPELAEVLRKLAGFCGDRPVVAHNGFGYDFLILDAACGREGLAALPGERLDTLELAHLVAPRTGHEVLANADGHRPPTGRSLDELARWFGLSDAPRQVHRALADAELTAAVLSCLVSEMNRDEPVRRLQRAILAAGESPWSRFLEPCDNPPRLEACLPRAPVHELPEGGGAYDIDQAVAPVAEGGEFATGPGREYRPQQEDMARLVARALHRGERLAIEAPTGTGKTFAYLTPSVEWARVARTPVVIATHSRVLQNQLLSAIAQFSEEVREVDWVLLKGFENYISVDRLAGAIDVGPADPLEALSLAVIAGWACMTPTGDWDDLQAWQLERRLPGFSALRWTLSVDSSPGPPSSELDELCFYRRALEHVEVAEIAVLNHAVLVTRADVRDMAEHVIIDEAHNLEEAATTALTRSIDEAELHRLFRAIHDPEKRWGTLGRYLRACRASVKDPAVQAVRAALERCHAAVDDFGPQIVDYIRSRTPARADEVERFGASYRIRPGLDTDRGGYWQVRRAAGSLSAALIDLAEALQELPIPDEVSGRYSRQRLESEIARMGRAARAAVDTLTSVVAAEEDDAWISLLDLRRQEGRWSWAVRRVPIDVSSELAELWSSMRTVVITSATLRADGSFGHLIDRLGLGAVEPRALPTPFDRISENELVVIPDHLPTPRGGLVDEFTIAEADELARLFLLTGGRGLALFTARDRMFHARDHVRERLEPFQLTVLCQGDEPAPALIDRMRNERSTSLLATRSFWEGVDIPGESLSLLVIEKLPFASPGDPVVAARMDLLERRGRDPFAEYLVPEAVLHFVQGVGRLIRSRTDVGVVVVLDKRLRKPLPYREAFTRSLPGPPRFLRPLSAREGYEAIAEHLGVEFTDELFEMMMSLPSADPWGDIEELQLSDDEVADHDAVVARLELVRERLGFEEWRDGQLEVMRRFLMGEDVLAVLPTGTGKSLTYQIPALLRPGLTLVVSPLVALMRDQVESLRERGMTKIAAVTSGQSQSEQEEILARARGGHYKLLYVSPERLWTQKFRLGLADVEIARIAVDEAHCIAQWGHTFRPEYLSIPRAIDTITWGGSRPPILAATATATPEVQKEIVRQLRLELRDGIVTRDPDRPELRYYVQDCANSEDRDLQLVRILDAFRGRAAIVYVPSREKAVRLAALLRSDNHVARPYHGGMNQAERLYVEESFREGELDVVVGTKAFGLGIDKPDVALIVHLEMPASVEEYVQETGRAARGAIDGTGPEFGTCVLLRTPRDCGIHRMFIKGAAPERENLERVWHLVRGGEQFITADDLAESAGCGPDSVGLAIHHLEAHGALERRQDVTWQARVWVPSDAEQLYREAEAGAHFPAHTSKVLRFLVDRGSSDFHLLAWSERLGLSPPALEQILLELQRRDVIGFFGWRAALHLVPKKGASPDFAAIDRACQERRRAVKELSERAKDYRSNDTRCRRAMLLGYLGADPPKRCDGCDVCRPDLPRPWEASDITSEHLRQSIPARAIILALIDDLGGARYSRRNIVRCLVGQSGKPDLPERLREHHLFGALGALGNTEAHAEVDRLIAGGELIEVEASEDGRTWTTLKRPKVEDN